MKESASFSLLCQCLQNSGNQRGSLTRTQKTLQKLQPDWYEVARLADLHFVSPLLYHQLEQKKLLRLLPEDLQVLLTEIYELNRQRNNLIYSEINHMASLLNPAGIEPIFLKGCAALLMELYDSRCLRVMNDVDFLVEKKELPICVELMQSAGYYPMKEVNLPTNFYHHTPLVHDNHSIRFEIHERLDHDPLLDSKAIITESVVIKVEDGVVRVPEKKHFAVHNILHHHVFNRGLWTGIVPLYQLYDLYAIREKYDRELDWKWVGGFFKDHSLPDAYSCSLGLLRKYFNQSPPAGIHFLSITIACIQCKRICGQIIARCTNLFASTIRVFSKKSR